jgi:hypothetical protein
MADGELRIAHTETLFRSVNERIAESAERFSADIVCECADPACAERIPATLDQYEEVRADATHFLLVPGHELEEVERVVRRPHKRLAVVEKFDRIIARAVRRVDPRAETAS